MIRVDPDVIPLGSQVYLQYPAPYAHLSGTDLVGDTGGAVKENIIDIFWGNEMEGLL